MTHLDVGILLEIFWTQVNKSVLVLVLVLMFTGGNITASYFTNRTFEHLAESGKQTWMWLMNNKHRVRNLRVYHRNSRRFPGSFILEVAV